MNENNTCSITKLIPFRAFHYTIFKLTQSQLEILSKKHEVNEPFSICEHQMFLYYDSKVNKYLAIDNSTGDFHIEEFTIKEDAMIWLLELKSSEVLQKAEEEDYWW